jgi:hypothetical protein
MTREYNIYYLKNGKVYLSNGCPKCSDDKILLTKKDIELLKKGRIKSKDILKAYNLKKKKFTTDLNNKLLKEIQDRKLKHKDTLIFDEVGIYEKRKKMANKRFKQRQKMLRGIEYGRKKV